MVNTSIRGRDIIIAIYGSTYSVSLQVSPDGGPSNNDIFVEEIDGGGSGLDVYYSCWNAILGIGKTRTSYNFFVSYCCISQVLEGNLENQRGLLRIWNGQRFLVGVQVRIVESRTHSYGREAASSVRRN